jgi:hypothetical protein
LKTFLKRSTALLLSICLFGALQTGIFAAGAATTTPSDTLIMPFPFGLATTTEVNDIASHPSPYLYKDTQDDTDAHTLIGTDDCRQADAKNYMVYRVPLASKSSVTQAHLILTVSQDYAIWVTGGGSSLTNAQINTTLAGTSTYDKTYPATQPNDNKTDVPFDLMSYINSGNQYVYFIIGDHTPSTSKGGIFYQGLVTYNTPVLKTYGLVGADQKGQPASFVVTGDSEQEYLYQDAGSTLWTTADYRFMDNGNYIVYRMPYDSSKDAFLKLTVGANYYVDISVTGQYWYRAAKNADNYDTMDPSDPTYADVHSTKTIVVSLSRYKNRAADFIYFKIGDQTTSNGNGGQIYNGALIYAATAPNALYDPFNLASITNPIAPLAPGGDKRLPAKVIVASSPNKASSAAAVATTSAASQTGDETYTDTNDETTSTVDSTASATSSAVSSSAIVSSNSGAAPAIVIPGTQGKILSEVDPVSTSIIIGAIALVLVGGAVAQFILFERKRRLTKNL